MFFKPNVVPTLHYCCIPMLHAMGVGAATLLISLPYIMHRGTLIVDVHMIRPVTVLKQHGATFHSALTAQKRSIGEHARMQNFNMRQLHQYWSRLQHSCGSRSPELGCAVPYVPHSVHGGCFRAPLSNRQPLSCTIKIISVIGCCMNNVLICGITLCIWNTQGIWPTISCRCFQCLCLSFIIILWCTRNRAVPLFAHHAKCETAASKIRANTVLAANRAGKRVLLYLPRH